MKNNYERKCGEKTHPQANMQTRGKSLEGSKIVEVKQYNHESFQWKRLSQRANLKQILRMEMIKYTCVVNLKKKPARQKQNERT